MDVDDVLVGSGPARWDADLEDDFGIAPDDLEKHFFAPAWVEVQTGLAKLEDRLAQALEQMGSEADVEDLIAYWFDRGAVLREDVFEQAKALRDDGWTIWLATNQEPRRMAWLMEHRRLKEVVDHKIISADVGRVKPNVGFFEAVERIISARPEQLIFIDDSPENADVARARGWKAAAWEEGGALRDMVQDLMDGHRPSS